MKKLLSIFLAAALIILNIDTIKVSAQLENYMYSKYNSSVEIEIYTGPGGNVTIPSKIDGYTVTSIGSRAFASRSDITSITIPNSVTRICECAFDSCTSLTNITIPNNVTGIGFDAFYGCTGLTSITIPNSVTGIGNEAFAYCSNLKNIILSNSLTEIAPGAFMNCSSLTNITIPNSVTSIDQDAFEGCSKLTDVTIPNGVTSIGLDAFEGCSNLINVTIPSSVTSISSVAFGGCSSNLTIYYHNTAIGFTNPWNGYKTVPCNIVSYNGNGNTGGTIPVDNNVYTKDFPAVILRNTGNLVKIGYVFAGWNTSADGSGVVYPVNSTVPMNGEDITLYAQWIDISVKGDFNADNVIDNKDLAILREALLSSNKDIKYDINGDNKVNVNDYLRLTKMIINQPVTDDTNITGAFIDDNFRNAVYSLINKNSSSPILYSDVKNIQNLNLDSMGIKDLNGLEYFSSLKYLYCNKNQLTSLNVSKNTALTTLDFSYNKILGVNIDNNTSLTYLDCSNNQLTSLDISKNTKLIYLDSSFNKLTALDVSLNRGLTYLDCKSNQLTALDVSSNTSLTYLSCYFNHLATLDVSKNTALNYLFYDKNQVITMNSTKGI